MSEESNQFTMKIMTLSIEILTTLYSRDLTHEELVQYRKRFSDYFDDLKKGQFPGYSAENLQHLEAKIKNEMMQFNEQVEKERKERLNALGDKVCCACQSRCSEYRMGAEVDEYYCIPCSFKYGKVEAENRVLENPVN